MYIQPPVVCDYQTVTLSVELTDMNGTNLIKYLEYSGNQSLLTAVFDMEDGLVTNPELQSSGDSHQWSRKYIFRTRRFQ